MNNTYEKCALTEFQNCIETPDFHRNIAHAISIVSIPVHMFAFYCVIFKTPTMVKSVKSALLLACFCNFVLDFHLTVLSIPYLLAPAIAGCGFGFLNDINFSVRHQTWVSFFLIIAVACSIPCLMQNRYCQIAGKTAEYSRNIQSITYICNCLFAVLVTSTLIFDIPEQVSARIHIYTEVLPCLPRCIYDSEVFVISRDGYSFTSVFALPMFVIAVQVVYFTFSTWHHLYAKFDVKLSMNTRRLQKKVFMAICLQVTIPLMALFFPTVYIGYVYTSGYFNQGFNNIATSVFSLHGFLQAISMTLTHRPYRQVILCETRKSSDIYLGVKFFTMTI